MKDFSLALVGIHDNLRSQSIFILVFEKEKKFFCKEEHDAIKPSHISMINYLESMGSLKEFIHKIIKKAKNIMHARSYSLEAYGVFNFSTKRFIEFKRM